jgi:hypothetical protein
MSESLKPFTVSSIFTVTVQATDAENAKEIAKEQIKLYRPAVVRAQTVLEVKAL